jgi:hypothetical protein
MQGRIENVQTDTYSFFMEAQIRQSLFPKQTVKGMKTRMLSWKTTENVQLEKDGNNNSSWNQLIIIYKMFWSKYLN